jgi:hypothetical protein
MNQLRLIFLFMQMQHAKDYLNLFGKTLDITNIWANLLREKMFIYNEFT